MHRIGMLILEKDGYLSAKTIKKRLRGGIIFMFCSIDKKHIQELRLINKKYYDLIISMMIEKITKNIKKSFYKRIYEIVKWLNIDYMASRKIIDTHYVGIERDKYFISIPLNVCLYEEAA